MLKNAIRILAWATLLAIFVATVSPLADRPHLATGPSFERIGAFLLLGALFCVGYRRVWPMALLIVLLAAGGFEALQLLTPDRHARIADALVKAVGGIGGVAIGLLVTWRQAGISWGMSPSFQRTKDDLAVDADPRAKQRYRAFSDR